MTDRKSRSASAFVYSALTAVVLATGARAEEHEDTQAGEGEAHEEEIVRLNADELREFGVTAGSCPR